jgi:hypothetical protein
MTSSLTGVGRGKVSGRNLRRARVTSGSWPAPPMPMPMPMLGIIWLVIARLRLSTIGPRKRKEKKKSAVPSAVNQPVRV